MYTVPGTATPTGRSTRRPSRQQRPPEPRRLVSPSRPTGHRALVGPLAGWYEMGK